MYLYSRGFLDTTRQDFDNYMAYLDTCPLVTGLRERKVPVRVVRELQCYSLYQPDGVSLPAAWVYTYQGLETKVVIYLPGDTPYKLDTLPQEIPAPGLCSEPRPSPNTFQPVTKEFLQKKDHVINCDDSALCPVHDSCDAESFGPEALSKLNFRAVNCAKHIADKGDTQQNNCFLKMSDVTQCAWVTNSVTCSPGNKEFKSDCCDWKCNKASIESVAGLLEMSGRGSNPGLSEMKMSDFWWKVSDVQRLSNWDKSNLFVAASRCLSQLIMLIP